MLSTKKRQNKQKDTTYKYKIAQSLNTEYKLLYVKMDTSKILVALNDPARRDATVKQLLDDVRTIKDEHGEKHELICFGKLFLSANNFRNSGMMCVDIHEHILYDDDIILATNPKTGSHWVSNILTFLVAKGPLDNIPTVQIANLDYCTKEQLDTCSRPRVLHTHTIPEVVPRNTYIKGRKIVLTFRNPKDTAVSMFHFLQKERMVGSGLNISWNCFLEHWMKSSFLFYNFFDFYNKWETFMKTNKDVCIYVVYFEDLKKNGLEELRKLQKFLGLSHSDERLRKVLDKCSLNNLKAEVAEKKCVSPFFDENFHKILYRKGEIGDWKTHFTVAQNEQMDEIIAQKFKDSVFLEQA